MSARPSTTLAWPIPMAAVDEIAYSECGDNGPDLVAYLCPAGVPTIGWGETDGVHLGDKCTPEQADQWLLEDLTDRTKKVQALCTVPTSPNELGALVSLAYNIGNDGLKGSTVLRCHNAGDKESASRAFNLWNKYRDPKTGQLVVSNGLTARRAREQALYLKPEPGQRIEASPQAVEAETPMRESKITRTGVVSAITGVGALATQVSDPIKQVKGTVVDTLGIPAGWFLPLVLIAVGAAAIYWRVVQRRTGWV